jgi:hypothetical protein
LSLESLEPRQLLAVSTFVQGVGGYAGAQDTVLYSISPNVNFGTETGISVDQQDVGGVRQGLLKFDNIIGSGLGQIPAGSTINSATVTMQVFNDSNSAMQMSLYRMRAGWDQNTATWNSFGAIGGVQASEGEVEALPPDSILFDASTGTKVFDVATSLRHWAAGEANVGWLIESAATNGWDFNTSEAALANRPVLTVDYTAPGGVGQFQFLNLTPFVAEGQSGTATAMLTVARLGGTTGAADVDYAIAAGGGNPATAGTDFVAAGPTTLHFADGETVKTVPVTIYGDTDLEGLETLTVTLSNATNGATISGGAGMATLTIGDDDALINEVVANITNVVDETNREYIELRGTPGASLDGYYFVVFEGEEEENGGTGSGIADLVVNLSGQSFGSNGLFLITGNGFAYQSLVDAGTNQLKTSRLDGVGGRIEDSSQTYALIKSPVAIIEGTDYDTIGAYENTTQVAIGTGVGILDQLPAGAQLVDSVGVVEGGGGDRDRVATTATAGHPGIHVHQPEGFGGGNVTSDAVSRRFGQDTPSTIGVWYNGDIPNGGATPIAYANGTTAISVAAPGGAVITPGTPNILRNVFFTVKAISVDENAGTVTLTVERSGDVSQEIQVNYATTNITAFAGQDFGVSGNSNQVSGTLTFVVGDSSEDIVIPILTDSVAEGFETFGINLSNPTSPFLITVGSSTVTINDGDVFVKTFQDNVNDYQGTADTFLNSIQPDDAFGYAASVIVDEEAGSLTGSDARPSQGLLRFDDLFGSGPGQVPRGSQIFSAFLTVNVVSPTGGDAAVRFFRMQQAWDETTATWTDPLGSSGSAIVNGVTPDDVEAAAEVDTIVTIPGGSGLVDIPLNRDTIQAWANGTLANFGWAIVSDSPDDWNFASSDDFLSINPQFPKLTVLYTPPTATQGTFGFSDSEFTVNENGTATVKVHRIGGTTGAATVNYEITAGTGALSDISASATGSVTFADNDPELFKTITIPVVNDIALERNETLNLTLSGAGLSFDRPTATLTIRDNDFSPTNPAVLLSEVYINSPGNDGKHEFAELTGTVGAGLGSLYLAILGGDVGEGEGSTDLVVDLGPYLNGTNGTTLVTALNDWGFRVPGGTTQIARPELDTEIVSNDTATYALLYSPSSSLLTGRFDYDWDNDGSLELPTGVVFVDSVANKDNGALDQTYGPASNIILSSSHSNLFVADAISRARGNTARNSAAAWFNGDLIAAGDDPLVYDAPNSVGLPVGGAAMTPGEINTGTAVQSPLVSLLSVTPNPPVGAVALTFSGAISQLLDGGGAYGVSITNADGSVNPQIDVQPVVTGLGTNTLTLAFTGAGVSGGLLPAGTFQLNFVGNSLIGNGRAVDAANSGSATGSDYEFEFTVSVAPSLAGDYDRNGVIEQADHTFWRNYFGDTSGIGLQADGNGNGAVDAADYTIWRDNLDTTSGAGTGSEAVALAHATVEDEGTQTAEVSVVIERNRWDLNRWDLAFLDAAFAELEMGSLNAKAIDATAPLLASPEYSERILLLAADRREVEIGTEHQAGDAWIAECDGEEVGEMDNYFAELGEEQMFGRAVASCLAV